MKTVLYFYLNDASFVLKDIEILKKSFNLKTYHFKSNNYLNTCISFAIQLFFLITKSHHAPIFITQFAGYHSFLPTIVSRISKKKHFIVLGGTDCNWLPSINYGNFNKFPLKWFTQFSLNYATHLIPVNKELVYCKYTYTENDFKFQGYSAFFPKIKTPYTVIPNGINLSLYKLINEPRQKFSFITTCSDLQDERRRNVKGIDLILKIAISFPECNFTIVGGSIPENISKPENIITVPYVTNPELPKVYNNYQFYLQLSLTEGFPNALIEAMACGCVPIVSAVGSMPDIVANCGYILPTKDVKLLEELLRTAIQNYSDKSAELVRIQAEKFDIKYRESALLKLITSKL